MRHNPASGAIRNLTHAHRITVIAPMIRSRRMSRWPIFDVRPRTCFPPLECCLGDKTEPGRKVSPLLECRHGRGELLDRHCGDRSHSGHGRQSGRIL